MLYELLAGQPPFHGDNLATVLRQLNEEEPALLPRAVPRDLVVITRKALQKTPAQRYASAGALAADLRRWLRGEAIEARPVPLIERAMIWAARRPALAGMAAALLVVLAGASVLLWRSNTRLKDALTTADSHLISSLNSEARALMQSQDLKARTRVLEVVCEISQSGGDAAARRSLAVRGLLMMGLVPAEPLEVRYANRASKVGFSSDFTRYATGGVKSGCRVLDVAGKAPPLVLRDPAGQQGSSFLFSADGRWLVVKTRERMTRVYDLHNPGVPPFIPQGEKRDVSWPVAAFPPGGGHFLYAKGDDKIWLHRTDAPADAADEVFFTAPRGVVGLCYSPDGRRLAVQWYEGWGVLDVEMREKLWQQDEKISAVSPLWAPDGSLVGVGLAHPSRILLVKPESGLYRHVFMGHRGTVSQASFSPDGAMLLSIGWDAQLMLWDVATDMVVGRHALAPRGLGISPDGRRIAFAPEWDSLQVHDLARPVIWRSWEMSALGASQIYHIDLSADGAHLLNTTPGATFLLDAEKGVFRGALMHETHNSILTGYFDTPHRQRVLRTGANGREFRLKSPDERNGLALTYEEVPAAAFPLARTADHRHLIVQNTSGEHLVFEEGGKVAARLPVMERAQPVELSPDQTMAAYVSGGLMRVVRTADGTVLASEKGKSSWTLRFLADGSHLVGCTKETMQVWETRTWQVVARWPAWLSDGFPSFACSRDSSLLAWMVGDGVVELRETRTWQPLLRLTAPGLPADHSGRTHLVWSADSRRLIVAATGPKVYEWDIPALREELGKLGLDW
jgi:WD40 repeat protein